MYNSAREELIELSGTVENITYRREDTSFTVIDMDCDGELITVVGVLPRITEGEIITVRGYYDSHRSFGRQFRVELCERSLPVTSADLLRYLSSGVIKGIGPSTAQKIIEEFGENTVDVLENNPKQLARIKGISLAKAESICTEFKNQYSVREVMIKLERLGMKTSECLRVYKLYGAKAAETVLSNPYVLCGEGIGIGFDRADKIAEAMTEKPEEMYRIAAGILHILRHNLSNGHTCIPKIKTEELCSEMLGTELENVRKTVGMLCEEKRIILKVLNEKEYVFLPNIYMAEENIAKKIEFIFKHPPAGNVTLDKDITAIEKESGIEFEEKQKHAIKTAVSKGLLILTGGPGTGKTTTVNGILKLLESQGLDVALAAPTGRAAKRMSDLTGKEAKTIHRLLEVDWDMDERPVFMRNERNPLDCHALIVDELSMVDVTLFSSLMDALPLGCRLILVGDHDQLPPVGAGNVLHDLINSEMLPVVELTEVFRQALESMIVTNAHKIVRGEMPDLKNRDRDFFFMERLRHFDAVDTITDLCKNRLPNAYGYSYMDDIQVLCPSKKGECGTVNLNTVLQDALNPHDDLKKELTSGLKRFREGDKVMQIKNNYNIEWTRGSESGKGIFNGDVGVLKKVDIKNQILTIIFDDRTVDYPLESVTELELAYAVTVHKSQGNEFEAVIMPAIGVVENLSYRNLLYTAVTRAKSIMIIVGDENVIYRMARNEQKSKRYSSLRYLLLEQ